MRTAAAMWGIAGFSALIIFALIRLIPISWEGLQLAQDWRHWAVLIVNVLLMAYSEGYRGFQHSFSPKFAQRLQQLAVDGTTLQCWLAPLYAMGYLGSGRRQTITTCVLTVVIVVLVILFHRLDQPWRGLLDAGVVIGLTWGLLATWLLAFRQLRHDRPEPLTTEAS